MMSSEHPSAAFSVRSIGRGFQSLLVLAAIVVLWELATTTYRSPFFPPPTEIMETAAQRWFSGPPESLFLTNDFFRNVLSSVTRLLLAWGAGAIVAIFLGVLLGQNRRLLQYCEPVIDFCRSVPPPALLSIFMIAFGTGWNMRFVFIAFGVLWIVLLNTITGVQNVEPLQKETARVFKASAWDTLWNVTLPAASPSIAVGVRLSLSAALILTVVSEMVASNQGIGFVLTTAQRSFATKEMWAAMVVLAVLGYLLNRILITIEYWALAWHREAHRRAA